MHSPAHRTLMVAVPAYNCSAQIQRVIRQFTPEIAPLFTELVVIDNQSRDDTIAKALEAAEDCTTLPVTVLRNVENYSLGGTHKVAFQRCLDRGHDGVVILHGDDQGRIADFAGLHDMITANDPDCVLGARFMTGADLTGYAAFRVFGNHVFNALYTACTLHRVYDMGSGLNYYSRALIERGVHTKMPDDLTFNNCMLLATYAAKAKVAFAPISWREEDQVSNAKLVNQSLKLLKYLWLYLTNRQALLSSDFREMPRADYPSERQGGNALSDNLGQ
ncbi:MAG: glycosyltransferase family 2 protein [Pseudomonadota bacterium]